MTTLESDGPQYATHFLARGRAEGFRRLSRRRTGARAFGADRYRGWRDTGHCQTTFRPGEWRWELAIKSRGDAYRLVYALQLGDEIWVVHAFQKKSRKGASTPKMEIDLVRERIKRLKEQLP
jgi:hypothetical protein